MPDEFEIPELTDKITTEEEISLRQSCYNQGFTEGYNQAIEDMINKLLESKK